MDDHHQLPGIVGSPEQQVVDGVERILVALGGDRRHVAPRVLGPDVVVEKDDPAPVAAGAEDALVAPQRASPLAAAERLAQPRRDPRAPRAAAQRAGRSFRTAACACRTRRPSRPRRPRRRARRSAAPTRSRSSERGGRPGAARPSARSSGAPRRRPRRRPRLGVACALRRCRGAGRRPRTWLRARPRRRPSRLRTRGRSSSPRRPARAPRRAGTASARARPGRAGRSSRPTTESRICPFGARLATLIAGRGLLEPLEVPGGRRPAERDLARVPVDRLRRELLVQQREAAEAAVADDLRRHALVNGARRARVDEEREVGVAVDVDEAGRDDLAGRVDLPLRLGHVADEDDEPSLDRRRLPGRGSAPVPSTTRPLRIARSIISEAPRSCASPSTSTRPSAITTP